jgi:hypothetical protein
MRTVCCYLTRHGIPQHGIHAWGRYALSPATLVRLRVGGLLRFLRHEQREADATIESAREVVPHHFRPAARHCCGICRRLRVSTLGRSSAAAQQLERPWQDPPASPPGQRSRMAYVVRRAGSMVGVAYACGAVQIVRRARGALSQSISADGLLAHLLSDANDLSARTRPLSAGSNRRTACRRPCGRRLSCRAPRYRNPTRAPLRAGRTVARGHTQALPMRCVRSMSH